MGSVYEARWKKAKFLALNLLGKLQKATQEYGKQAIFVEDGYPIEGELIVDNTGVYIKDHNSTMMIFENNLEFDHGYYSTVKEIEEKFEKYKR